MHLSAMNPTSAMQSLAFNECDYGSPVHTITKGAVLFAQGTPGRRLYRVERGLLIATITTATGRTRIPDLYGPGDILGSAALDGGPHFETVSALRKSSVHLILANELAADSRLRASVSRSLADQCRRARRQADEQGLSVGARLARLLLRLGPRLGTPVWSGFTLPPEVTHEMLADLAGASRVTITRVVNELQTRGAITGGRGKYTIHTTQLEAAMDEYALAHL